jgi:hypothetical protein
MSTSSTMVVSPFPPEHDATPAPRERSRENSQVKAPASITAGVSITSGSIGETALTLRCSRLHELLGMALMMSGTLRVIENEILVSGRIR